MVGQHIGKYRVTQQIGRGGMGTVYAAIDETLHRDVAIKVLNAGLNDPTVARRFRAEAVTVARLNHPAIATIYELVQHDGQWLMVMEFVRGDTLEQAVSEKGPLPVPRAAELTMQALSALAHAHSLGVVHRDLKPANLMLTAGGGMKIMDFGIARVAGAEQLTSAGFMMGTPAYMAPEQVLGQDIDARTDLYAMGLVLYHVVSGALPFKGTTPIQVAQARIHEQPLSLANERPDLPRWLADVVDIALQREPMKRFRTALDFREAVRRGLANLPIERPDSTALPPELMATAAPGSMRVEPTPATGTGRQRTEPSPVMTAMAVDLSAPAPPRSEGKVPAPAEFAPTLSGGVAVGGVDIDIEAPTSSSRSMVMAAAAALVLAGIGGGWYLMRGPADVPPAAAESASIPDATSSSALALATPSGVTPAPAAPTVSMPAAAGSAPTSPTVAPAATLTPTPNVSPAGAPAAAATGARGTPTGVAPVAGPPARGRAGTGRGAAAAAAPVSYPGVRAFVVTGRRVDERVSTLTFADRTVSLVAEAGGATYGAVPYGRFTSAAYTRGRNPRWYPTLAGPPADIDMPGGLFRGDRHWLALQSRDTYIIVRMNDGDWRAITETVTSVLGLKVEELRP